MISKSCLSFQNPVYDVLGTDFDLSVFSSSGQQSVCVSLCVWTSRSASTCQSQKLCECIWIQQHQSCFILSFRLTFDIKALKVFLSVHLPDPLPVDAASPDTQSGSHFTAYSSSKDLLLLILLLFLLLLHMYVAAAWSSSVQLSHKYPHTQYDTAELFWSQMLSRSTRTHLES